MLFIGPHVSISGSVANALDRAKELGATGFAIFTKNQRQWKSPELKEEDIILFTFLNGGVLVSTGLAMP